jgi:hypothetical protein
MENDCSVAQSQPHAVYFAQTHTFLDIFILQICRSLKSSATIITLLTAPGKV